MGRARNSSHAATSGAGRRGVLSADTEVPEYQLDTYNKPLDDLYHGSKRHDGYDMDTPYQRGHVWDDEQKVNLIKSIVQGLPIGSIYLNQRDIMEPTRVVDGKQRLTAIIDFMEDKFSVPATFFPDRQSNPAYPVMAQVKDEARGKERVVFSDLSDLGRRRLSNFGVATYSTQLETVEEEAELYERLNFGGVNQNAADQARARAVADGDAS